METRFMAKIVLIGNTSGTLLNFRKELIIELINKGHTVYCLVSDYTLETKTSVKDLGAIPIESTLNSKGINPIADIKSTIELSRILKEIKPDIVFSYFVKPVIFGTLAAKKVKVPRIIGMIEGLGNAFTPNDTNGLDFKKKTIQRTQILLYKFALPLLDALIVLNPDDHEDLVSKLNIKLKEVVVLGGIGVDLEKFKYTPVKTDTPVSFVFIARLLKEKGVYEYLKAAENVKGKYPETIFYILGGFDVDNPFALRKSELDSYLSSGIVDYPGYVKNVANYLNKSSVFVLPSYREGFPRSTQEAMAIGRPIITTDVPGCRETVEEGINGYLIPPYDTDALTDKMLKFIEQPELINRMGRESRRIAESKFDISEVNDKLINILFPEK